MNYLEYKKYKIIPTETYKIIRNCSGCGCKSIYNNTNKFRVNANGKHIDIWLIYQCSKCKHTYNLPIYSRVNPNNLDHSEYQALQRNDKEMAIKYGLNKKLFQEDHAEILSEPPYIIKPINDDCDENTITFLNPYHLKIRHDKLISEALNISRSKAKKMIAEEVVLLDKVTDDEIKFKYAKTCLVENVL